MVDRSVVYRFVGDFRNLTAGLTAAGRNVTELGTKMTALDKNGAKMRAGLTSVGSAAGRASLLAAAGLAVTIGAAARFDKAMSAVQAATHETAGNMELLRKAAIKAGADTAYSASESAGAIEQLAKAGISTSDILAGGLSGSLNLAAAGAIGVADAAELAATAMTQFRLSGDQVNHVADLLSAGAGKAQGSVADLGMALKQSGLVAAQTGLSIEETVGTLSAFASAGLLGSDAGTSFKTMLQSLTPTGEKAGATMDSLGISAYDAQGNFVGMTEFAGRLRAGLADLSVEQQNAALKTIFGSDAVRAASVIYQQGADGIQGWIDKTNDAGYAATTAATRMDNLAGDLEQLKGSLETAFIGAGEGSQGPLRQLVRGATDAVNAFNGLPPAAQNATTALLGITAVTGGALWFGSKVITGIADTKQALANLGIEAGRTKALMAGIGKGVQLYALIEGINILDSKFDELFDRNFDETNLNRNLEALAGGRTVDNLDKIGKYVSVVNSELDKGTDLFVGWLPGDTTFRVARDELDKIDQSLAGMVESGNGEQAAAIFAQITEQARAQDVSLSDISGTFGQYQLALDNASASGGAFSNFMSGLTDRLLAATGATKDGSMATGGYGVAAARAANAAQALSDQMREQRKDARDVAQSFLGLGDSLDDSKKSLSEWLRELEKQNEALRNFTTNARTAAERGLDEGLIQSLNEAGPAGALRMKQLADGTEAEIKRANKAWREGQAAIREYVNMTVPEKKLRVDNSDGLSAIHRLQAELAAVKSKDVEVRVHYMNFGNKLAGMAADRGYAGGGLVRGRGGPRDDLILAMLSDREFVMPADAVQYYGIETMEALRSRTLTQGDFALAGAEEVFTSRSAAILPPQLTGCAA